LLDFWIFQLRTWIRAGFNPVEGVSSVPAGPTAGQGEDITNSLGVSVSAAQDPVESNARSAVVSRGKCCVCIAFLGLSRCAIIHITDDYLAVRAHRLGQVFSWAQKNRVYY
jgi:hypothetical protein